MAKKALYRVRRDVRRIKGKPTYYVRFRDKDGALYHGEAKARQIKPKWNFGL